MADSAASTPAQTSEQAQDVGMSKKEEPTSAPSASSVQGQAADDQAATAAEELCPDKRDRAKGRCLKLLKSLQGVG